MALIKKQQKHIMQKSEHKPKQADPCKTLHVRAYHCVQKCELLWYAITKQLL